MIAAYVFERAAKALVDGVLGLSEEAFLAHIEEREDEGPQHVGGRVFGFFCTNDEQHVERVFAQLYIYIYIY
jgi:hypothetical protein